MSKDTIKLTDKKKFDIKFISENLEILKDVREEDIALFAERLAELPKDSDSEEKSQILTYILRLDSWFSSDKQLTPSKEWIKVVCALEPYVNIDFRDDDLPICMDWFWVKYDASEGHLLKEVLDPNSFIVDVFSDVWIAVFKNTIHKIALPMIFSGRPINKVFVTKALDIEILYFYIKYLVEGDERHYQDLEKMDLVDTFKNSKFSDPDRLLNH